MKESPGSEGQFPMERRCEREGGAQEDEGVREEDEECRTRERGTVAKAPKKLQN